MLYRSSRGVLSILNNTLYAGVSTKFVTAVACIHVCYGYVHMYLIEIIQHILFSLLYGAGCILYEYGFRPPCRPTRLG
jgi:hypothetical protein